MKITMSNCKQCGKEIESNTGRRPREYCNDKCRMDYFNKNKTTKVWKATHEKVLLEKEEILKEKEEVIKENEALKGLVAELQKNNPIFDRGKEKSPVEIIDNKNCVFDVAKIDKRLKELGAIVDVPAEIISTSINKIPTTLAELKLMCPPELKGIDKASWIGVERLKYGL